MKTLRKNFYLVMMFLMTLVVSTSCSKDGDAFDAIYHSLFVTCDFFIDGLDTIYEHYDAFGYRAKDTSDGKYTVTPIGRLIIVEKKSYDDSTSLSSIVNALKSHYSGNSKVNDVFLNNGGTITIDCRN
ncbi:MAG: hypothetical protein K5856_08815 [Bacteroidaceae bacterium]|nr:hypothetical protein [Bacteroidaceae bacterium]